MAAREASSKGSSSAVHTRLLPTRRAFSGEAYPAKLLTSCIDTPAAPHTTRQPAAAVSQAKVPAWRRSEPPRHTLK